MEAMVFLSREELEFVKNLVIDCIQDCRADLSIIDGKESRIKLAAKLIEACEREDTKHTTEENEPANESVEALGA